jgi:hypothetical protein
MHHADAYRPVDIGVAAPHHVNVDAPPEDRNYGFADCAAILDVTSAAFPTGLRQDPAIDVPIEDFEPKSDEDKRLQGLCESISSGGADDQTATLISGRVLPSAYRLSDKDSRKRR